MEPVAEHRDVERARWDFFLTIPPLDRGCCRTTRSRARRCSSRCSSSRAPAPAAARRPYLKLVTQLFGDRMIVANATGCSSIYGANLPTTPWTTNAEGRGPAWNNSLFEDNAEFGLGMRLALDAQPTRARAAARASSRRTSARTSSREILDAAAADEPRSSPSERVARLREALVAVDGERRRRPAHAARARRHLVRKGVWIIGGDGWAYDIGFGGLDHVLSSGRNVNILVLDTEVYSEHRRPGVEGDAARRRRQVRRRRQGHRQEGPRRDRACLRQRLRRPDLDGRERLQTDQGAPRGRRLARPVARHRLQHLHRPRHRHVEVDDPPEGRGQERLLAAVPLPADPRSRTAAVQARLEGAVDPGRRLRRHRDALRHPRADAPRAGAADSTGSWPRPTPTSAGATTSSSPASQRTVPHVDEPDLESSPRSRATPATGYGRGRGMTATFDHPLPRPRAALADRGLGVAAQRRSRMRSLEDAGVGAIVMPSLFEEEILHEEIELNRALEAGSEHFAEALDYFPASASSPTAGDRYLALERLKGRSPCRSSPASTPPSRAVGSAMRALIEEAGADALELNLYHVAADPDADGAGGGGRPRAGRRGPRRDLRSRWRSSSARTTRRSPTSPRGRRAAPTGSCCSTASTSQGRIATRRSSCPTAGSP